MAPDWKLERCSRCGKPYREHENSDSACLYHPGRLKDYDRYNTPGMGLPGDFWDCCQKVVTEGATREGCTFGCHVKAAPDDPGPIQRELQAEEERYRRMSADYYEEMAWTRPERVEDARWRVRRHLAGRLKHRDYETELARKDVAVLERADFAWLLQHAADAQYTLDRRRFIASLVADPEKTEQIRRAVEAGRC